MNRPYCKVPTRAASANLSAAALRVLIYLCACADDETGECWPTKKTIARETGLTPRTVRRATEELARIIHEAVGASGGKRDKSLILSMILS